MGRWLKVSGGVCWPHGDLSSGNPSGRGSCTPEPIPLGTAYVGPQASGKQAPHSSEDPSSAVEGQACWVWSQLCHSVAG